MENATPPSTPQICPLAIWSLVLSLLGVSCFLVFGAIPAIILGHMALARIKASGGMLTGEGFAIAGLVLGYIGAVLTLIAFLGFLAGLLLPAFAGVREKSSRVTDMNNLKQLGLACQMYAAEHAENMPSDWKSVLNDVGTNASASRIFVSPRSGTQAGSLDMVDSWSDYALVPGRKSSDAPDTVLAFSKPNCHHGKGGNVLHVDVSVHWLNKEEYDRVTGPFLQ